MRLEKKGKYISGVRGSSDSILNELVSSRLKEYSHLYLLNQPHSRGVNYRKFRLRYMIEKKLRKFRFFQVRKLINRQKLIVFRLRQEYRTKFLMSKRKLRKSDFISLPSEFRKVCEYVRLMLLDLSFFREARLRKLHSYYYYEYLDYRVYREDQESKVIKDECFLSDVNIEYLARQKFFLGRYDKWLYLYDIHLVYVLLPFYYYDEYTEQNNIHRDLCLLDGVPEDFITEFRIDPAVKWVKSSEEKLLEAALVRSRTEVLALKTLTALSESISKVEALARALARAEVLAGAIAVQELKERELN